MKTDSRLWLPPARFSAPRVHRYGQHHDHAQTSAVSLLSFEETDPGESVTRCEAPRHHRIERFQVDFQTRQSSFCLRRGSATGRSHQNSPSTGRLDPSAGDMSRTLDWHDAEPFAHALITPAHPGCFPQVAAHRAGVAVEAYRGDYRVPTCPGALVKSVSRTTLRSGYSHGRAVRFAQGWPSTTHGENDRHKYLVSRSV